MGLCGGGTAANWTCWVKWKLIVLNNFELGKAKGTNIFLFCQRRSWRQQQQQLALFIVSQNGRVFSFVPLYLPLSRSARLPAAVIIDSRLCILGHFVCVNRRRCDVAAAELFASHTLNLCAVVLVVCAIQLESTVTDFIQSAISTVCGSERASAHSWFNSTHTLIARALFA